MATPNYIPAPLRWSAAQCEASECAAVAAYGTELDDMPHAALCELLVGAHHAHGVEGGLNLLRRAWRKLRPSAPLEPLLRAEEAVRSGETSLQTAVGSLFATHELHAYGV